MASSFAVLLLVFAGLCETTAGYYCNSYINSNNEFVSSYNCYAAYCCGDCKKRYCCPFSSLQISDADQNICNMQNSGAIIGSVVVSVIIFISLIACCCCCPCCCMYQMCKKRTPVAGTHVTTVMNTQCIQQPPAMQYPAYQPVPAQPGYIAQPVQAGVYPAQPYAPGPPPSYHTAMSPGYPTGQPELGGGPAHLPSETSQQLAYNPAYMQPPKTSY